MGTSATNIGTTGNETGREETFTTQRPNPVALEVPVTITGARISERAAGRDLFTEETKTVLVFRDGAVIHLSAGVAAGQLLFLTNNKNKREEVCQVVCKRNYKPTSCFVELEFTEAAEDFWGVEFPKEKVEEALPRAAEDVVDAEVTEESSRAGAEQGPEELARLKEEVARLREQLKAMVMGQGLAGGVATPERPTVAEAAIPATSEATTADQALKAPVEHADGIALEPVAVKETKEKVELAHVNDQHSSSAEAPTAGKPAVNAAMETAKSIEPKRQDAGASTAPAAVAQEKKEERRPVVKMTLPSARAEGEKAKDGTEDLLPKPGLDFSKIPAWSPHPGESDPNSIYKRVRGRAEKILLAVLVIVLVAILGFGVWFGGLGKLLAIGRSTRAVAPAPAKASAKAAPAGNAAPSAVVPVGKPAAPPPAEAAAAGRQDGESGDSPQPVIESGPPPAYVRPSAGEQKAGPTKAESDAPPAYTRPSAGKPTSGAAKSKAPTNAAVKKSLPSVAKKSGEAAPKETGAAVEAASAAISEPIVAAKLIRAATPVYPPDAMRKYITGDVKGEVVVQADGSVGTVKVLSGPAQLRDAAVEALKQYKYEAATQGGKAVESKVVVVVKFWFDLERDKF